MIRRGFLEVDPALLAWVLAEIETASCPSIQMSALGEAQHWQGHEACKGKCEGIPFLRAAAALADESSPPTKVRWWANVLRTGAGYRAHKHDGKWAFVYHLTEGASVHFEGCESFPATPGQILVFDAKLSHWTDKVDDEEPRVSIAGNLYFRKG
jgi:hypothetical protein